MPLLAGGSLAGKLSSTAWSCFSSFERAGILHLESGFCELTCALVRMSAIDEIEFLDEEYGFYYEDADFGFRLRKAGYGCAYLAKSQIDHFSVSTINKENWTSKASYIAKTRVISQRSIWVRRPS